MINLFFKNISFRAKIFTLFFLSFVIFSIASFSYAQTASVKNDFVLEPGKVEIFANPGESITKSITVTNRASSKVSFKIEVEDFVGSDQEDRPVVLLGDEKSPYSFKDNVVPEMTTFSLDSGGSMTIPIKINVPANAEAGGFYTSVLVSNAPTVDAESQSSTVEGKTKIISRVGTLFFIRVNGTAEESGYLEDVQVIRPTSDNPDLYKFNILFNNDGNVHLVPYGWVTVTDTFGKTVGKISVDAYFALPQSVRYREVEWNAGSILGRYKATVQLNRGYGSNLVDTKTVVFWVISWKVIAIALGSFVLVFSLFYLFFKKFKLVAKQ